MNITSQAIENGIYLQKLSRKETVAVMILLVGEFYFKEQEFSKAIEIFELVLQFDPKSVFAMLKAGSSYGSLLKRDFFNKYKTIREIPAPEQKRLFDYLDQNRKYYAKAESLGWREPPQEADEKYEKETLNAQKPSAVKGMN
jgi:tetratricopeptide (TPR) repeat protein